MVLSYCGQVGFVALVSSPTALETPVTMNDLTWLSIKTLIVSPTFG